MNGEPERLTARERAMAELLVLALEERRDRYCEQPPQVDPLDAARVALFNLRDALRMGRDALAIAADHADFAEHKLACGARTKRPPR